MPQQGPVRSLSQSNNPSRQLVWTRAEDLQGIMAPPAPVPIAPYPDSPNSPVASKLSRSFHLSPNPGHRITRARDPAVPSLLEHNEFAYPRQSDLGGHSVSRLRATEQDVWSPLHLTGLPAMTDQRPHMPRISARGLDETTSQDSQHLTSEIGTQANGFPPSDSGYITRTASIKSCAGSATMNCERQTHPSSHGIPAGASPYDHALQSQSASNFSPNYRLLSTRPVGSLDNNREQQQMCNVPGCDWIGKCPSDIKKHMQRHEKRHRCDVQGCRRKDGFGTQNDLDRHKKCVHHIDSGQRVSKYYKCFGENCLRKDHDWPRYDNFRQHLRRMHSDEDVEELIRRSEEWNEKRRELPLNEECCPGSDFPMRDASQSEMNSIPETTSCATGGGTDEPPTVRPATLHPGSQASISPGLVDGYLHPADLIERCEQPGHTSNILSTVGRSQDRQNWESKEGAVDQMSDNQLFSDLRLDHKNFRGPDTVVKSASGLLKALEKETENTRRWKRHAGTTTTSDVSANDSHTPSFVDLLRQSGNEERSILQNLVRIGLEHLDKTTNSASGATRSTSESDSSERDRQLHPWVCSYEGCGRRTRLECELRKHVLRHERRYGCTFTGCKKKFGSKNDWKRHENTRHFQHQSWFCQEPVRGRSPGDSVECGKVFRRRDLFAEHLRIVHKVNTNKRIKESLRQGQLGRNGQVRFWCGFCQKPVSLKSTGLRAWDDRYDHIDDEHFKKGQDIADWVPPPESDVAEDQRRRPELKRPASAKRPRSGEDEEICESPREERSKENEGSFGYFSSPPPFNQPVSYVREPHTKRQKASPSPEHPPIPSAKYQPGNHFRQRNVLGRPASSASATNEASQKDQAHQPSAPRSLTNKQIAESLFLTRGEPIPKFITCCRCIQYRRAGELGLQSRCPGELHSECSICNHQFCLHCKREWRG